MSWHRRKNPQLIRRKENDNTFVNLPGYNGRQAYTCTHKCVCVYIYIYNYSCSFKKFTLNLIQNLKKVFPCTQQVSKGFNMKPWISISHLKNKLCNKYHIAFSKLHYFSMFLSEFPSVLCFVFIILIFFSLPSYSTLEKFTIWHR